MLSPFAYVLQSIFSEKTFVDFKQHISSIVMLTAKVCSKALQQMSYYGFGYYVVIVETSISPCWMTFIFLTSDFSFQLHMNDIWKNGQLCLWSSFLFSHYVTINSLVYLFEQIVTCIGEKASPSTNMIVLFLMTLWLTIKQTQTSHHLRGVTSLHWSKLSQLRVTQRFHCWTWAR